jgi:hypothetical protein
LVSLRFVNVPWGRDEREGFGGFEPP